MKPKSILTYGAAGVGKTALCVSSFWDFVKEEPVPGRNGRLLLIGREENDALGLPEEFVRRFHREAKLAATMDHPNVVRILDEGVHEGRHHYIVMEYAEGMKLTDLMSDGQPLSPQQTIEIMHQVCEALQARGYLP